MRESAPARHFPEAQIRAREARLRAHQFHAQDFLFGLRPIVALIRFSGERRAIGAWRSTSATPIPSPACARTKSSMPASIARADEFDVSIKSAIFGGSR